VLVVPERSKNTTGSHVEGMTSTSLDVAEGATSVVIAGACTLGREKVSGETLAHSGVRALVQRSNVGGGHAFGAGMESVQVGRILVDKFDDVNLQRKWESTFREQRAGNRAYLSAIWPKRAVSQNLGLIS
jgi:hypothetical protein